MIQYPVETSMFRAVHERQRPQLTSVAGTRSFYMFKYSCCEPVWESNVEISQTTLRVIYSLPIVELACGTLGATKRFGIDEGRPERRIEKVSMP